MSVLVHTMKVLTLAALTALLASCSTADGDTNGGAPGGDNIGVIGGMCGGIAGFQCEDENAYCATEPGVCHNTADYAGVCKVKPQMCTREYRPVCGCDGKTYSNACTAAADGASVAYTGACVEQ